MSLLIASKRGPKGSYIGKIHSVAYHRNGIGGLGFHEVIFDLKDKDFPENPTLHAIVTYEDDQKGAEAFLTTVGKPGEAWRGSDYFGDDLRKICERAKWPHEIRIKS